MGKKGQILFEQNVASYGDYIHKEHYKAMKIVAKMNLQTEKNFFKKINCQIVGIVGQNFFNIIYFQSTINF